MEYSGLPLVFEKSNRLVTAISNKTFELDSVLLDRNDEFHATENVLQIGIFYVDAHYDFEKSAWFSNTKRIPDSLWHNALDPDIPNVKYPVLNDRKWIQFYKGVHIWNTYGCNMFIDWGQICL